MVLNNNGTKQLREAILSAFPDQTALEIMLSDELDINLDIIAEGNNYEQVVFNLIKKFNTDEFKIKEFIESAHKNNPTNPLLHKFYDSYSNSITEDNLNQLRNILNTINFSLIKLAYIKTLPDASIIDDGKLNSPKNLEEIINILLTEFPQIQTQTGINKIPSILEMVRQLAIEFEESTNEFQQLKAWCNEISSKLNIEIKITPKTGNVPTTPCNTYLFVIVYPEDDKFRLNAVNAALYLRRPLLVTGNPGSGKTSLAYAIAHELKLGTVLTWSINARSTLQDGLYRYDAIARLQDAEKKEDKNIGDYIQLGAVGTAFLPSRYPRVLLIDEIDKSDINLPNDLLNIFEEGAFDIPELVRRAENPNSTSLKVCTEDREIKADIFRGRVRCAAFPIVIMTSNGEREFPPAFLRRCLRVKMPDPKADALKAIVKAHFKGEDLKNGEKHIPELIEEFLNEGDRATDQLLNTIYLLTNHVNPESQDWEALKALLQKPLSISDEL